MMSHNHRPTPVNPPITTNSLQHFPLKLTTAHARATHIVIHARFPILVESFLAHKRTHGSRHEKRLYALFTWRDEVRRLIEKRPLVFMGGNDFTVLRDGRNFEGMREWDRNGREDQGENRFVTLAEYLSYDEMMLSSLVGVSGPSCFVNDGGRFNQGVPGRPGTFEEIGVIVGLVGARFERRGRMDSVHAVVDSNSFDTYRQDPRLISIFQDFFGCKTMENSYYIFNREVYKARMRITIDILLLEANSHAKASGRKAHVYVVGLGLGVWEYDRNQASYYIHAFCPAIEELGSKLACIGTIEFAWINGVDDIPKSEVTSVAAKHGIKVVFSKRNPAEKLRTGELLVLSYAWDGNAFPGNEYWVGSLDASGDPAAACMSTISELHNPTVNPGFLERIEVLG